MADLEWKVPLTAAEIEKILRYSVLFTAQNLSELEKAIARANIGAAPEESNGFEVVGYFDTLEDLEAAIPEPEAGPFYGVGEAAPYDYYSWDELHSVWVNNGTIKGVDGAPGADGKDAVITPEQVEAGLGYNPSMVNPNLLDNWYFVGGGSQQGGGQFPINQRGNTVYNSTVAAGYCIDRWWNIFSEITLNSDGINIFSAGTTYGAVFRQAIANPINLAGKTVTLSVLVKPVSSSCYIALVKSTGINSGLSIINGLTFSSPGLHSFTIKLPEDVGTTTYPYLLTSINVPLNQNATILAVKLELGSVQTLARQVNGEWVLNEVPDYGEELAKCCRQLHKLDIQWRIRCVEILADYIRFAIPLPQKMRATPSIINTSNLYVRDPQITKVGSDFTFAVEAFWGDTVLIRASKTAHGFSDAVLLVNNGAAFLSAEL